MAVQELEVFLFRQFGGGEQKSECALDLVRKCTPPLFLSKSAIA